MANLGLAADPGQDPGADACQAFAARCRSPRAMRQEKTRQVRTILSLWVAMRGSTPHLPRPVAAGMLGAGWKPPRWSWVCSQALPSAQAVARASPAVADGAVAAEAEGVPEALPRLHSAPWATRVPEAGPAMKMQQET